MDVHATFTCLIMKIKHVSLLTENQIMSDGEQDLPDDIMPLPPPPDRYVRVVIRMNVVVTVVIHVVMHVGIHACLPLSGCSKE